MYIFWTNDSAPIKVIPLTAWPDFMSAVRIEAVAEWSVFIVDEDGLLVASDVARDVPELLRLGAREFWLRSPGERALKPAIDAVIGTSGSGDAAIATTGGLSSLAEIATLAPVDRLAPKLGTLRSVIVGVFGSSRSVAVTYATEVATAIAGER
jgi:hypothetical protein